MEDGTLKDDFRKRSRREDSNKKNITLGSLSLAQIEEINKKNELMKNSIENSFGPLIRELVDEKSKMQSDWEVMLKRVQALEEEKLRQVALWSMEERKITDLEADKKKLGDDFTQQQGVIQQLLQDVANREQYELELDNMVDEEIDEGVEEQKKETDIGKYNEPTDYNASQELVENFGNRMAEIQGVSGFEGIDEDREEALRRSLRYKGKEGQKVEDLAKIRAEERNNYGSLADPTSSNASLLRMTSLVGVDLGCSIDMIDRNIEIIKKNGTSQKRLLLAKCC